MLILDTDHMSMLEWGGEGSAALRERLRFCGIPIPTINRWAILTRPSGAKCLALVNKSHPITPAH